MPKEKKAAASSNNFQDVSDVHVNASAAAEPSAEAHELYDSCGRCSKSCLESGENFNCSEDFSDFADLGL